MSCLFLTQVLFAGDFVCNLKTGGRFGEQLQGYLHAKWLSYKYEIPLLYSPFSYSTHLRLDDLEIPFDKAPSSHHQLAASNPLPDSSRYTCYLYHEERGFDPLIFFDVEWKDPKFRKIVLEMIAPKEKLSMIYPPKDALSIAIHVREGGGFDSDNTRFVIPLKLPPMSYYKEALLKVFALFPNEQFACYLFTDAANPEPIAEELKSVIPMGMTLEFRKENRHDINVLEDFFSLFNFDILIRSQSQFSLIPSFLHDYLIDCSPVHFVVENGEPVIDQIQMEISDEKWHPRRGHFHLSQFPQNHFQ